MQPSTMDLVQILVPSGPQLLSLFCLLLVAFGFVVIGAAIGGKDRLPEADLLVGWAVCVAVMTVGGRLTALPLSVFAAACGLGVVIAALVLWRRRQAPLDPQSLWVLAMAAPFLVITASMQPSQWDEFSQWLPNTRYLFLFDVFPGPNGVVSDSVFPSYPHAIPLVSYFVSRLCGYLAESAAAWFNLLLLVSLARSAIRLFRRDTETSIAAAAWGWLAVTGLATTFVPKLVLSTYAETGTTVALALCAALGWRLVSAGTTDGKWGKMAQFAAVFVLLPMTKQGNFALMGLLLLAMAFEFWRTGQMRKLPVLVFLLVPAVLVALTWRSGFTAGVGELSVRPLSAWEWALLPAMLESMLSVITAKGGYFGLAMVLTALALRNWRHPDWAPARTFTIIFIGYNGFLLFVYLAIMSGYESANAASYWRYNTHVGALQTLVAASIAGMAWRRFGPPRPKIGKSLAVFASVAALVGPFAVIKHLRFDRQPVKVHIREVAADLRVLLPEGASLVVIDPRGTGFYANFVEYLLGFGRQVNRSLNAFNAQLETEVITNLPPGSYVWVHTQTRDTSATLGSPLASNASHLLHYGTKGWLVVKSWPFPGYDDPALVKD